MEALRAFAERHGFTLTDALHFLVDSIPLIETQKLETLIPNPAPLEPKTEAPVVLSPSPETSKILDSPTRVASDPIPLEINPNISKMRSDNGLSREPSRNSSPNLSVRDSALTDTSNSLQRGSKRGLASETQSYSPTRPSRSSLSLQERLDFEKQRAEIWLHAHIAAEQGVQTVREQARRFRSGQQDRRAHANYDGIEKGEADHGRPDFD